MIDVNKKDVNDYVDALGNFDFVKYTYDLFSDSMKHTLDMGTLLSNDQQKLRAFKEQVKKDFRTQWKSLASVLELVEVAGKCFCQDGDYCKNCGGARYVAANTFQSQNSLEVGVATMGIADKALKVKLLDKLDSGE